ncbi:NlpC/P60 family protein [Bacillus taeanensis]|uniref:NlpC/P60 domain-containing protein n=1 Tax=Bacillus taeanensis TaxID=273032 RepID=A0A366XU68_9BACI|nr:NlpC/P60 family protein [Bacillus taeanensis]RBW69447.1 hypothetical protein DS031_11015 [Bacillus taeanensis]
MSASFIVMTTDEAIARYNANYNGYLKHEVVKVNQYREAYKHIKGSLADQIVERAIWYMEHGYTVYGMGHNSYHSDGVLDCSNFTKLVYGDFGIKLSGVAKKYDTFGTRVKGVYPHKVNRYWQIEGTEHLLPGDLLTWWYDRSDGYRIIGHVGIYMGKVNGKPTVICTAGQDTPTAIGIITSFKNWWGKHFYTAQRVLPDCSWTPGLIHVNYEDKGPVIPKRYILPPQKPLIMPKKDKQS